MIDCSPGKRVRLARILKDLTQLKLARAARLPASTLSLIENDLIKPKPREARRINQILGEEIFPVEVEK